MSCLTQDDSRTEGCRFPPRFPRPRRHFLKGVGKMGTGPTGTGTGNGKVKTGLDWEGKYRTGTERVNTGLGLGLKGYIWNENQPRLLIMRMRTSTWYVRESHNYFKLINYYGAF